MGSWIMRGGRLVVAKAAGRALLRKSAREVRLRLLVRAMIAPGCSV